MQIPYTPVIFGYSLPVHLIFEYLAFFVGYRYYIFLRRRSLDQIAAQNRLYIIIGAALGALLCSRITGILENPFWPKNEEELLLFVNSKSIMGGLFGGMIGVEVAKKIVGEKQSSGSLFTLPVITGIFIGRIGCFLTGINEFTYGKPTDFVTRMNLGDGIGRHPVALYELFYLCILFFVMNSIVLRHSINSPRPFAIWMLLYFSFRFFIEFLKPDLYLVAGLSSIQWLCLVCVVFYLAFRKKYFRSNNLDTAKLTLI